MKVCMINDCAYVGETLIRYYPNSILTNHIKRSRGWLDKTFGIAWKIFRAKGELFHVHYALQDAYLTLKLNKEPVLLHVHGTDVRETIDTRKWGWMVRHNLEKATKVVVDANDVFEKTLSYRNDAEMVPIPLDLKQFNMKPMNDGDSFVIFSPYLSALRGSQILIEVISQLELSHPNIRLRLIKGNPSLARFAKRMVNNVEILNQIPNEEMPKLYEEADVVVSDLGLGYLTVSSLEAMAIGRPVIQFIRGDLYRETPPVVVCRSVFDLKRNLTTLLALRGYGEGVVLSQRKYVEKYHDAEKVANKFVKIYEEMLH